MHCCEGDKQETLDTCHNIIHRSPVVLLQRDTQGAACQLTFSNTLYKNYSLTCFEQHMLQPDWLWRNISECTLLRNPASVLNVITIVLIKVVSIDILDCTPVADNQVVAVYEYMTCQFIYLCPTNGGENTLFGDNLTTSAVVAALLVVIHMRFQVTFSSKTLFTLGTLVTTIPGVILHVLPEITLSRETLVTFQAWKWFVISVY